MVAPPQIELGSLGMADSLILMVLALVVFGPRRLPQIGRQIGKLMYEFRKASNDFKFQMEEELRISEDADRRKKEEAERARNLALNPPAPAIEAQAAVGADDQASVSAPPDMYSAEAGEPAAADALTNPGSASTEQESNFRYPRINPPATGQPVAADRSGTVAPVEPATDGGVTAEANIGAEGPSSVPDQSAGPGPGEAPAQPSEPSPSEPVSQHG